MPGTNRHCNSPTLRPIMTHLNGGLWCFQQGLKNLRDGLGNLVDQMEPSDRVKGRLHRGDGQNALIKFNVEWLPVALIIPNHDVPATMMQVNLLSSPSNCTITCRT